MPTPEQPTTTQQPEALAGMPEQQEQFRTIAVRVQESLHAQLSFIAQLAGTTLSEEIRAAVEHRIATAQDDPQLIARAQAAREQIEREAAARAAAIAGFMGSTATAASTPAKARRTSKTTNE
jgi:hypothetical protein